MFVREVKEVSMAPRNIKSERVRIDLSLKEAAEQLQVATNTLGNWEQGRTVPSGSDLARLARFYGCSADWLLGITEERLPH